MSTARAADNQDMAACCGFPKTIQIQTTIACGARCRMCPHPVASKGWSNGPMGEPLFRRIVDQCRDRPVKRICPYLMADPLCDRQIFDRIGHIRSVLPEVEIEVSTTAQTLVPNRVRQLVASPITELRISSHGISREDYALLMPGIDYSSAWANLQAFIDAWESSKPYELIIVALFGLLPPEREAAIAEFWGRRGIRLDRWRVTSRGDQIDLGQFKVSADPTDWPQARREPPYACRFGRDREWMHILSDGRVALCCMDYGQEVILGDLTSETLDEVWNGERYRRVRSEIAEGAVSDQTRLCRKCEWYVSQSVLDAKRSQPASVSSQV